jgi:hypothetical protein
MRHLSIADYDAKEREACISASYPALRCFSPIAFAQASFPTRAAAEAELIRYADIMYETLPRCEYLEERTFIEAEAEAIMKLSGQIRAVTTKLFGRTVQPLMCLFPPIPIVRAVEAIAKTRGRGLRIFEIGPGSGAAHSRPSREGRQPRQSKDSISTRRGKSGKFAIWPLKCIPLVNSCLASSTAPWFQSSRPRRTRMMTGPSSIARHAR